MVNSVRCVVLLSTLVRLVEKEIWYSIKEVIIIIIFGVLSVNCNLLFVIKVISVMIGMVSEMVVNIELKNRFIVCWIWLFNIVFNVFKFFGDRINRVIRKLVKVIGVFMLLSNVFSGLVFILVIVIMVIRWIIN